MRGDHSTMRAIRGPIILITLGVLFALQSFNICGFDRSWPVLLIVVGLLSLFGRGTRPAGPWGREAGNQGVPPPPNYNWPPPAGGSRGPSYSQSPYAQPATPGQASARPNSGGNVPARDNPPAGSNAGGSV